MKNHIISGMCMMLVGLVSLELTPTEFDFLCGVLATNTYYVIFHYITEKQ